MKNHVLTKDLPEIMRRLQHIWEQSFEGKLLVMEICAAAKGAPTRIGRTQMIELEEQCLAPPFHPLTRDFLCAFGDKGSEGMTALFSSPQDSERFIAGFTNQEPDLSVTPLTTPVPGK